MLLLTIALAAFFITVSIAVILYFKPKFLSEGFAMQELPKCISRCDDAQFIFKHLTIDNILPGSDVSMAIQEFKLILQKILSIEADILNSGMGSYSSSLLPYATAHDIEPAISFVNRCLVNAINNDDIETAFDKFLYRGKELIDMICTKDKQIIINKFQNIINKAKKNIEEKCIKKVNIDIPAGARDPGYFIPNKIEHLHTYSNSTGKNQYI